MEKNYSEKKVNLHTHTAHCRHASGLPEDYCAAALEQNFEILGFSDHAPFPDERYHGSRMFFQELKTYRREVEAAKAKFPDLHVLAGLEVEYCPDLGKEFYSDYLLGEVGLDYLIGAAHFVKMPDGTIYPFYSESWGNPEVIQAFFRQELNRTVQRQPDRPFFVWQYLFQSRIKNRNVILIGHESKGLHIAPYFFIQNHFDAVQALVVFPDEPDDLRG